MIDKIFAESKPWKKLDAASKVISSTHSGFKRKFKLVENSFVPPIIIDKQVINIILTRETKQMK